MCFYEMSTVLTVFRCKDKTVQEHLCKGENNMQQLFTEITKDQLRSDLPSFRPGDTVTCTRENR